MDRWIDGPRQARSALHSLVIGKCLSDRKHERRACARLMRGIAYFFTLYIQNSISLWAVGTFSEIYFCHVFNHFKENHGRTPLDKIFYAKNGFANSGFTRFGISAASNPTLRNSSLISSSRSGSRRSMVFRVHCSMRAARS